MDREIAREILKTVVYRPGWKFELRSHWLTDAPTLLITSQVQDSSNVYAPDYKQTLQVSSNWPIDHFEVMSRNDFLAFIMKHLCAHEIHEAREFFKLRNPDAFARGAEYTAPFHPHMQEGNAMWDTYFYDGVKVQTSAKI